MTGANVSDTMPRGTTSGTPQVLLAHHLKQLKLPTVLREYDKVARECARDGVDHPRYLLRLIELELIDRERRTVERHIRAARFPAVKSFDTFDFAAIPGLNKMLVLELSRCEYILRRENIIALGNSGTGKTHVALALGLAACQKGFTVAFTTAAALVSQLLEARDERRLLKLQRDLAMVNWRRSTGVGQAADHRRTWIRPAVAHWCRAVVRDFLAALRTGLHHRHLEPAARRTAVRRLDISAGVRATDGGAAGQADPPRQHPLHERRQLSPQGIHRPASRRCQQSRGGAKSGHRHRPDTGEITQS